MNILLVLPLIALAVAVQSKSKNLDPLLDGYFEVKNALVKGDATLASEKAEKLEVLITNFDMGSLHLENQKIFAKNKDKLLQQVQALGNSQEIEGQRTQLAALSEVLWDLTKNAEDVSITVYYDYCPMKKSSWLSEEAAIKNPFYGNKMLSCGKVQGKIN